MKIAMVTQWYDPEVGSAITPGAIARALRSRGNDVHVITGFPNYPQGRLYPGYHQRPHQHELLEDVHVHRAPLYLSHDAHAVRRAANYLSFAASAGVVGVTAVPRVDATLVHSTPATVAIPAMTMRLLRRTPYVVHIQDLWPDTVVASSMLATQNHGRVEQALHRFCDSVYRHAASIAVTSPGMADLVAARGIPEGKIAVVPNWADERYFHPVDEVGADLRATLGPMRPFTVMYAGAMGEVQGLDVLIGAAELLRGRQEIGFVLIGGGVAERSLKERAERASLDNVRFVGHQPVERMAELLALGDVQVITLQDRPLFRSTTPSKVQATLAAGRPIISTIAGDGAAVVRESGAGLTTTPGSAGELAEAIVRMSELSAAERRALGERGRLHYAATFSEERGSGALESLLRAAAAGGTHR